MLSISIQNVLTRNSEEKYRFPSRPELSSVELEQLPLLLRKLDAHRSVFNRLKLAIEFKCELIRPQSGEYGLGYCFRKVNKQLDATADRNLDNH